MSNSEVFLALFLNMAHLTLWISPNTVNKVDVIQSQLFQLYHPYRWKDVLAVPSLFFAGMQNISSNAPCCWRAVPPGTLLDWRVDCQTRTHLSECKSSRGRQGVPRGKMHHIMETYWNSLTASQAKENIWNKKVSTRTTEAHLCHKQLKSQTEPMFLLKQGVSWINVLFIYRAHHWFYHSVSCKPWKLNATHRSLSTRSWRIPHEGWWK